MFLGFGPRILLGLVFLRLKYCLGLKMSCDPVLKVLVLNTSGFMVQQTYLYLSIHMWDKIFR